METITSVGTELGKKGLISEKGKKNVAVHLLNIFDLLKATLIFPENHRR